MGALSLLAGTVYLTWRWGWSVNWTSWWIAVPLVLAETYAFVDSTLFTIAVWRARRRPEPPLPDPTVSVDVFVTTYDEPVDLVAATAAATRRIRHPGPVSVWVLDDGARPDMRRRCEALGVGYLTRGPEWQSRPRHAKAGNVNAALARTAGELVLILDADQVPEPAILERTLGWFSDPEVALVQTPQWFANVPDGDPLGSQAPLFYGPIQQGKDGWNAAFFCGSNAVLRREALLRLGLTGYAEEVQRAVAAALRRADGVIARARNRRPDRPGPAESAALDELQAAVARARTRLSSGLPTSHVTYAFQREVEAAGRRIVGADLAQIAADLADVDPAAAGAMLESAPLSELTSRDHSPWRAVEEIGALVRSVDVDRDGEALPVMPIATISVTEDMATSMALHAHGWRSVYHHEVLARGLAPEDLGSMLSQRLRWAQGTMQVLLRQNPLTRAGLSVAQRLMYFATAWSYLSGFAAVALVAAPVLFLTSGVLPVQAWSAQFLAFFLPAFVLNQVLFAVVGRGMPTWRGQQYAFAMFPVWIRACTTAWANVVAGRPLGFVVTPKTAAAGGPVPWRLVRPQLLAACALVVAGLVGLVRGLTGLEESWFGLGLNWVWAAYLLTLLSVLGPAMLLGVRRSRASRSTAPARRDDDVSLDPAPGGHR